jgi:hypothetical protein
MTTPITPFAELPIDEKQIALAMIAQSVECPECKAPVGSPCVRITGAERITGADKYLRAGEAYRVGVVHGHRYNVAMGLARGEFQP